MKIFNGRADLDLSKFIVRFGGGISYRVQLFDWKGVPLWYTSPESVYGEAIWVAPDDGSPLPFNWRFYGYNVIAMMRRKPRLWWIDLGEEWQYEDEPSLLRFRATTEEALDRLVSEAMTFMLKGGAHE